MDTLSRRALITSFLCSVAVLLVLVIAPRNLRIELYIGMAVPLAFGACAWAAFLSARHLLATRQPGRLSDLLTACLLVALLVVLVPARVFIENDESSILATALAILHNGNPIAPATGIYESDGTLVILNAFLDKRGVFFAAIVSLFSFIPGLTVYTAPFLVNAVCTVGVLFLLLRLSRRFGNLEWSVYSAAVLMVSMPMFVLLARASGFDIMNLFFLLLFVHLGTSLILRPDARSLWLAVATGMCFCQLRQESFIVVMSFWLGIMALVFRTRRFDSLGDLRLWIIPLTFIPVILRLAVPFDHEIRDPGIQAFSAENFIRNLIALVTLLFVGDERGLGNPLVGVVGLVGAFLLIGHMRIRSLTNEQIAAFTLMTASVLLLCAFHLFYYHSRPDETMTARYFLPVQSLLCLLCVVPFSALAKRVRHGLIVSLLLLCVVAAPMIFSMPKAYQASTTAWKTNILIASSNLTSTNVQCDGLLITDLSLPLLIRGFSSLPPTVFGVLREDRAELIAGRQLQVHDIGTGEQPPPAFLAGLPKTHPGDCQREIRAIRLNADPPTVLEWYPNDPGLRRWFQN